MGKPDSIALKIDLYKTNNHHKNNFSEGHLLDKHNTPSENPQQDLSLSSLKSILEFFKGHLKRVIFTGGEPTLYPKLEEAVDLAKGLGYEVGITSNGSLIRERVFNKLDEIHISLFSLNNVRFKDVTGYDLRRVQGNVLVGLNKWKDKLRINKVVLEEELGEGIFQYIESLEEMGIRSVSLFSVVGDLRINSKSVTDRLINLLGRRYKKVEEVPRYTLFVSDSGMEIFVKKTAQTEMCKNCPLADHCEGKCGIRVTPDEFMKVCFFNLYPPLDLRERNFSPEEAIRYYTDGKLPKSLENNEIERKYKVEKVPEPVIVLKEVEQRDVYWKFSGLDPSVYYIRFRKKNNRKSFDFHVVKDEYTTVEYETEIEKFIPLEELFKVLGGEVDVVVDKDRKIVLFYRDGEYIKATVDQVKDLGQFIEVEGLSKRYVDQMFELLNLEGQEMDKGYPNLLKSSKSQ